MLYHLNSLGHYVPAREDDVIAEATDIYNRFFLRGTSLTSPDRARDLIKLKVVQYEVEVFLGLFLDTQHQIISCDELFKGTLDSASVYPREVVKAALYYNASALIFAHNHPSGLAEPSQADRFITDKLKTALAMRRSFKILSDGRFRYGS
jgi:DNA repair protein RadC